MTKLITKLGGGAYSNLTHNAYNFRVRELEESLPTKEAK